MGYAIYKHSDNPKRKILLFETKQKQQVAGGKNVRFCFQLFLILYGKFMTENV